MLNIQNVSYPAIIGILLAGLFAVIGCDLLVNSDNNNHPDWLTGSADIPEGIEFTLDAPAKVQVGEPVPIKLTFRNITGHDVDLFFGHSFKEGFDTPRRKNFAVGDADSGELVWSLNLLGTVVLGYRGPVLTLEAGQEITYQEKWDQDFGKYDDKYSSGDPTPKRDEEKLVNRCLLEHTKCMVFSTLVSKTLETHKIIIPSRI